MIPPWLLAALIAPAFNAFCLHAAQARVPGEPAISGSEPDKQGEKDWVDDRWQATDVGPFLFSNLSTPQGVTAKALTIKVGQDNEASLAYDTANSSFKACWTGGFLRFSPTRFGLTDPPKIDGQLVIDARSGPGWPGSNTRFRGVHQGSKRIVLEYEVDGTKIFESPGFEKRPNETLFLRSFEVGPHPRPLRLNAAPHLSGARTGSESLDGRHRVYWTNQAEVVCASATPTDIKATVLGDTGWILNLPPATEAMRFDIRLWRGSESSLAAYVKTDGSAKAEGQLSNWIQPGVARWLPESSTRGQRGNDSEFLAVDTLTLPYENPWKALLFAAGIDFTSDGAGYLCTLHGDVWRVTGVNDSLNALRWHRFATGLFQPLGLKVRDNKVYVLGRDRITRLEDANNDGEADFYESFFDGIGTSTGGHDYVTCLEQDNAGHFYYTDPKGIHKVAPDGRSQTTLATGWRNPNGLGVSPDGRVITVAPQQGTWTPSSEITEVKNGGYYGYAGPKITPNRPLGYDPHLCWIPHSVDNSSGSQVWVPEGRWGPLGGQMLHLLWGRCSMMWVLRDTNNLTPHGAVVPLPVKFLSGPNRGTFNRADGQLYVAGSTGWQTSATKDGALQRVRFTGKPVALPSAWRVRHNGIEITWTQPLDRSTAEDPGSYAMKQWNYRYTKDYGSKDWSVEDPSKEGRDALDVISAKLSPDEKSVLLEFKSLKPAMQMELKYNVNTSAGKPMRGQFWLTINQ